jgi:peptidyl-prolyl cis-trans isomerase C
MRSSTLMVMVMCVGLLRAAAQTSSPQAPPAPAPKTPATAGEKPGSQAGPTAPSPAKQPGAEAKEVAPDAPVITIKGLCSTPAPKPASGKTASASAAAKPAACETVVTRKQLESVIDTVRPNLQPGQRRMLAQQYAELLVMANAAAKAGTEKEPKVQEQIRLSKLQILASSYSREIQQKESEVPPADIEKYYKEHAAQYEQAKLARIYVPMVMNEEGKPPDAAATKALAEKIQQRAAAGEDFDKLQKEAFANSKGTAPSTELGERRRGTLPPKQEEAVFALKAGEVSPALEEASGFYIYKVVSKEPVPLDKVREEINGTLARERSREAMEKLRTSVKPTFNDAYFGSAAPLPTGGELHPPSPSPQTPATAPAQPATPAPPGTTEAPKPPPPAPPPSK